MKKRCGVQAPRSSKYFPGLSFSVHRASKLFRTVDVEPCFPDLKQWCEQKVIRSSTAAAAVASACSESTPATSSSSSPPSGAQQEKEFSLFCMITFQRCKEDAGSLIEFTDESKEFKDESRDIFFAFMSKMKDNLDVAVKSGKCDEMDVWVDWVDPATGSPYLGNVGSALYSDVDGIEQLLSYEIVHVGITEVGCRMVQHPQYGLGVYPATGFVACTEEVLQKCLEDL